MRTSDERRSSTPAGEQVRTEAVNTPIGVMQTPPVRRAPQGTPRQKHPKRLPLRGLRTLGGPSGSVLYGPAQAGYADLYTQVFDGPWQLHCGFHFDMKRAWVLALLVAASGMAEAQLVGTWTGRTSEGQELELTVVGGGVSAVKLGVVLTLDAPCPGQSKYSFDHRAGVAKVKYKAPVPITDGRFQLSFQAPGIDVGLVGEFSGDTAHGTWTAQASRESGCKGKNEGTWSVAKRGAKGRRTSA